MCFEQISLNPKKFKNETAIPLQVGSWSNDHLYFHSNDNVRRIADLSSAAERALEELKKKDKGVVIIVGGGLDSGFRHFIGTKPSNLEDKRILLITEVNPVQQELIIDWKLQLITENETIYGYLADALPVAPKHRLLLHQIDQLLQRECTTQDMISLLTPFAENKSLKNLLSQIEVIDKNDWSNYLFKFAISLLLFSLLDVKEDWVDAFIDNLSTLQIDADKIQQMKRIFKDHEQLKVIDIDYGGGRASVKQFPETLTGKIFSPIYDFLFGWDDDDVVPNDASNWLLPENYQHIRTALLNDRILQCSVPIQLIIESGVSQLWSNIPLLSIHASNALQYYHDDDVAFFADSVVKVEKEQGFPILLVATDCDYETKAIGCTGAELLDEKQRKVFAKYKMRLMDNDSDLRPKIT